MEEEAEPFVFWPYKGQLISYEMFTVTQKSETHVCLSNEDLLVVQDYILKATKVSNMAIWIPSKKCIPALI